MAFKLNLTARKCAYCGEEFQPKSHNQIYCKNKHYMNCPVCGKQYEVKNNDKLKFPPTACSYECRTVLRTQTSLKKYGCIAPGNNPEARKKASETMMKNLGVPYAMMSSEVQEKSRQTLLEKYGVDNIGKHEPTMKKRMETERKNHGGILAFNTEESYKHRKETVMKRFGCEVFAHPEIREKIKRTMIERYGEEHNLRVPELKKRHEESLFKHYGVRCAFQSPIIKEKSKQTMIERYGVENAAYSEELMKKAEQTMIERYGKSARISKINEQFKELLISNNIEFEQEHLLIGKWYDFFISDQNVFIEIDPTYTHNTYGNHWNCKLPFDYHIAKSNLAKEHGYRCIHVFDWDDWDKVIQLVAPRNKISARKCKIFNIYDNICKDFLNNYSLNTSYDEKSISLGLIYDQELVQVMVLSRPVYNRKYSIELTHLCTKKGYEVVGGASKLFNWAVKYLEIDNVIAYCDLSKFQGNVYNHLGMNHMYDTRPDRRWSKEKDTISDDRFMRLGYRKLFHKDVESDLSDEELMIKDFWLPIYDCGQAVYEWRSK